MFSLMKQKPTNPFPIHSNNSSFKQIVSMPWVYFTTEFKADNLHLQN